MDLLESPLIYRKKDYSKYVKKLKKRNIETRRVPKNILINYSKYPLWEIWNKKILVCKEHKFLKAVNKLKEERNYSLPNKKIIKRSAKIYPS